MKEEKKEEKGCGGQTSYTTKSGDRADADSPILHGNALTSNLKS
jgi:hypothetical protein